MLKPVLSNSNAKIIFINKQSYKKYIIAGIII